MWKKISYPTRYCKVYLVCDHTPVHIPDHRRQPWCFSQMRFGYVAKSQNCGMKADTLVCGGALAVSDFIPPFCGVYTPSFTFSCRNFPETTSGNHALGWWSFYQQGGPWPDLAGDISSHFQTPRRNVGIEASSSHTSWHGRRSYRLHCDWIFALL